MKKVVCEQCEGKGHIKVEEIVDVYEICQVCKGNGYLLYVEEDEAYGSDCVGGRCEV
jgi:excinuclease UvrABC ATPase subunit